MGYLRRVPKFSPGVPYVVARMVPLGIPIVLKAVLQGVLGNLHGHSQGMKMLIPSTPEVPPWGPRCIPYLGSSECSPSSFPRWSPVGGPIKGLTGVPRVHKVPQIGLQSRPESVFRGVSRVVPRAMPIVGSCPLTRAPQSPRGEFPWRFLLRGSPVARPMGFPEGPKGCS